MCFALGSDFTLLVVFFVVAPSTVIYVFSCVFFVMTEIHRKQTSWPDEEERDSLKGIAI
jgi:hypothetical protein